MLDPADNGGDLDVLWPHASPTSKSQQPRAGTQGSDKSKYIN